MKALTLIEALTTFRPDVAGVVTHYTGEPTKTFLNSEFGDIRTTIEVVEGTLYEPSVNDYKYLWTEKRLKDPRPSRTCNYLLPDAVIKIDCQSVSMYKYLYKIENF